MSDTRVYKIASVCGSGYATSGWIRARLEEEFSKAGVAAEIQEVKIVDLASIAGDFDLIVSASALNDVYSVPIVSSTSILTGVGFEHTLHEILEKLGNSGGKVQI